MEGLHDTAGHIDEFQAGLASLELGHAWFWGPRAKPTPIFARVKVDMAETFDSSVTPGFGEDPVLPEAVAEVDLEALREQMAGAVAEAEANDPAALKTKVARLERDLRKAKSETATAAPEDLDNARALAAAERLAREEGEREARSVIAAHERRVRDLERRLQKISELAVTDEAPLPTFEPPAPTTHNATPRRAGTPAPQAGGKAVRRRPTPPPAPGGGHNLTGPQRKILTALAWFRSVGIESVSRPALGALAGYKKGGHYDTVVSGLRTTGLVEYPAGGHVTATAEGEALISVNHPLSLDELQGAWLAVMNGPQQTVLRALMDVWPDALSRQELMEATGYQKGGHFDTIVSSVKTMGAAEYPNRGYVRTTTNVFPDGLR